MKSIKTGQLAMSYVGVFLGAGFVSGQELWQFFACFGPAGLLGYLVTIAIFFPIYYALLSLVHDTGVEGAGRLLICGNHPKWQAAVDVMQTLFLFGIIVIMTAGASALGHQLTGLPSALVGALFTLLVLLTALLGLQGLLATFRLLVPVTTVFAVILGIVVWVQSGGQAAPAAGSVSPLLPNWPVGALTYAAYNIFATMGVLIPLGKLLPNRRTLGRGLGLGSALLIVLAGSIIAALTARPEAGMTELPMMTLAGAFHPVLATGYGLLMALGMFAAALGSLIALLVQLGLRFPAATKHKKHFTAAISLVAFLGSQLGFGNLVGTVYPIFGYASIPLLVCLLINYRRSRLGTLSWPTEETHTDTEQSIPGT